MRLTEIDNKGYCLYCGYEPMVYKTLLKEDKPPKSTAIQGLSYIRAKEKGM